MNLREKMNEDMKIALKEHKMRKLGVLRMLLSALHNEQIKKSGSEKAELEDQEIITFLQKEIKKRKESALLYEQGSRNDLANQEREEIAIIAEYLPPAAGREEIDAEIKKVMEEGEVEMGLIIKKVKERLCGRADGKEISEAVKEIKKD